MCIYTHVSVALAADCLYIYMHVHVHTLVSMYMQGLVHVQVYTCTYIRTLRVKITCPKGRVLLSMFAASITRIHCARVRTTVEDHGCTGKGRHTTRTTTHRFSIPIALLLLYRAPSFGCSSFFVHRGLCKNRSIDVRGRTQCLHVNLYGPQLLYSSRKFGQVILTRTVYVNKSARNEFSGKAFCILLSFLFCIKFL